MPYLLQEKPLDIWRLGPVPVLAKDMEMTLDRAILSFAGFMILVSVALGHYVSPYWLFLTVFVGLNLIQSSFTGFCPAAMVLKKLGVEPGTAFN